ncbi:hypothetical protein FisN_6Hh232 [Fistulifera solaris]|jgi:hypothetical protein|uniref:Uncharacterized protein n=1 Tax=Fistulifera solaris TaxID=1519565 RepID=A0A1Z5K2K0_FISSO|nr:hypothetical protein FisN_6Hh232 [Fistulifera solaris]|eukprot:GAX20281.1 hypothetical protein FisN_6Hh232 [Fistulifera solaris]
MVLLAAAALGAVGYGTYRAGEEAVREGQKTKRNFQLNQRTRAREKELVEKSKDRQERLAELQMARQSVSSGSDTTNVRMQGVMARLKEDDNKKKLNLKNPFGRIKK